MSDLGIRHPATRQLLQWFDANHLPPGPIRDTSQLCKNLAYDMAASLQDGPELSAGLRKVLEAKDCFVRQAIEDGR